MKKKIPNSRKVLPTFQTFCPDGIHFAQNVVHFVVHFALFQNQARAGGASCSYISPKGFSDVKNRGWWWFSGQNETHLSNLYEKWAKVL